MCEGQQKVVVWLWVMVGEFHGGRSWRYFHLPPLLSPMIFPRRCLAVSGLDLGLDAARAAFTALAAAIAQQARKNTCIINMALA